VADVAVLRLEKGRFGFVDQDGARLSGTQKLTAEVTIKDGRVVYDLNGLASREWSAVPATSTPTGNPGGDAYAPSRDPRQSRGR
jgi:dihydroorotase